jgi:hypothetical protein
LYRFARLRLDQVDDAVDQRARGEILAGAGFGFGGVFLQQAFVEVAEAVFFGREPVDGVDGLDQLFQMARLFQAGLRVGVDGGNQRIGI